MIPRLFNGNDQKRNIEEIPSIRCAMKHCEGQYQQVEKNEHYSDITKSRMTFQNLQKNKKKTFQAGCQESYGNTNGAVGKIWQVPITPLFYFICILCNFMSKVENDVYSCHSFTAQKPVIFTAVYRLFYPLCSCYSIPLCSKSFRYLHFFFNHFCQLWPAVQIANFHFIPLHHR